VGVKEKMLRTFSFPPSIFLFCSRGWSFWKRRILLIKWLEVGVVFQRQVTNLLRIKGNDDFVQRRRPGHAQRHTHVSSPQDVCRFSVAKRESLGRRLSTQLSHTSYRRWELR
jgi:hypothetical protein